MVDPSADPASIRSALDARKASLDRILLTHCHFDHITALGSESFLDQVPLYAHESEVDFPADAHKNAYFSFFCEEASYRTPDGTFSEGTVFSLGSETIKVLHTPGHTVGSSCFLCGDEFLITGDTLFAEGYGRYDLYSGDLRTLADSLHRLQTLPPSLPIYPGHGESVPLGQALDFVFHGKTKR